MLAAWQCVALLLAMGVSSSEGQDWFGLDLRLQLSMEPVDWAVLANRRRVADALSEWQVRCCPRVSGQCKCLLCVSCAVMYLDCMVWTWVCVCLSCVCLSCVFVCVIG